MRWNQLFWISMVGLLVTVTTGCANKLNEPSTAQTSSPVVIDRRTPGTVIDDEIVEIKAIQAVFQDPALNDQAHLNITSYNGIVLLSGEAPNDGLKRRAGDIVSRIEKVRQVHNEVRIAAPSTMIVRGGDSYLSAKVKAALFADEQVPAHRIKVVTENSTVYLMGLATQSEADSATQVARKVGGVQRVVKLFEYTR
ncbi:MAG: BON domain-containing protein [Chromatiales bacterium]|nr:BON domain-containing protein [Chromatiales bacterium]